MELGGDWRAIVSDDDLRRSLLSGGLEPDRWEPVRVPGHWRSHAAFDDVDGPVLHHRAFTLPVEEGTGFPADRIRWWLEFDGVFAQSDVWLDGQYLGDTDGYFVNHAFELGDLATARTEHDLYVEVSCSPKGRGGAARSLLGAYEGGTDLWSGPNPGGIWQPVRVRPTGPVRIVSLRAVCREITPGRALVWCRAALDSPEARTVHVHTFLGGTDQSEERPLAAGRNEIEWTVPVTNPELWWPRGLGPQALHDLVVEVESRAGEVSDRARRRLGLRSVELRRSVFSVNGEPVFVRGCNLAPPGPRPADGADRAIDDLELAIGLGANAVRPYGFVQAPSFYAAADEEGVLVWQDLPLVGKAASTIRRAAAHGATALVDQLGHHPSIIAWNAHVGPAGDWMVAGVRKWRSRLSAIVEHELPTVTKSVLDRSTKHTFTSADGSRPTFGYTGVLPHPPRLDSSPTHLWLSWRGGDERDLPVLAARLPSQVEIVAELGAQSVPDDPEFIDPAAWPDLDLETLAARHGMQVASFQRYVPPVGHHSLASWIEATQLHHAVVVRRQVEELRRLKYRPTGAVFVHYLRDAVPVIGAGLVDDRGRTKRAARELAAAYAPVIVVADRIPAHLHHGDEVLTTIHAVSDLRHGLADAEVTATLTWPGGEQRWRFGGEIAPDACSFIGRVRWTVPDADGVISLHLELTAPGHRAANRYDTTAH